MTSPTTGVGLKGRSSGRSPRINTLLKQQNNNKKRCLHVEEDHREHEEDVDEVEDEEQEVGGKVL